MTCWPLPGGRAGPALRRLGCAGGGAGRRLSRGHGQPPPGPEPAGALSRAERVAAGWSYSAMGCVLPGDGQGAGGAGLLRAGARRRGRPRGSGGWRPPGWATWGAPTLQLGDARRAIGYYEQALAILPGARRPPRRGHRPGQPGDRLPATGGRPAGHRLLRAGVGDRSGDRRPPRRGRRLGNLGIAYAATGRRPAGHRLLRAGAGDPREIGDRRGEGNDLGNLGNAYGQLGDARRAIGYYEQALAIRREIGDRRGEGTALGNLGSAYMQLGDARRAIGYYEQALAIHREIGDRRGEGADLGNLGTPTCNWGRPGGPSATTSRRWRSTGRSASAAGRLKA